MVHRHTIQFTWTTPAFIKQEKTVDWYWWLALITIVAVGFSIYLQSYVVAALIGCAAFVLGVVGSQEPQLMQIAMSEHGIQIDNSLYPFKNLDAFWIQDINDQTQTKLILHAAGAMVPIHAIPVPQNVDVLELRDFLAEYLEEIEMHPPLAERMLDFFGI
jgi:hypothetical protein